MHLDLTTFVVRDYDEAIAFFIDVLGFVVTEDEPSLTNDGRPKRWVVVRPPDGGTGLLLARADGAEQERAVGNQAGGRVTFFLRVDDFRRRYDRLVAHGVELVGEPREESYGRLQVFSDLYGNKWDLLGPARWPPVHGTIRRVSSPPSEDQRLRDLALLRRVRDRIDREYAQPLNVEALARGVHMSAGHLSRQFRLAYGESPYSYLMTRRIERAMALLRRGDLSVTEVCFAVGCSSLGTFSTRFTELVGVPPSVYRPRRRSTRPRCRPASPSRSRRPIRNREAPVVEPQLA